MTKRAVFPGSFDPITLGHVDIIKRALPLFDEIIIAIGVNAQKKYMFSLEERKHFIETAFNEYESVQVKTYTGLTADFCKAENAQFILRGLRNTADFTYEQTIAQANAKVMDVESLFLLASPAVSYISSSIVRDIARNGGDYSALVPFSI
ncbi:pantetheine-phosphate adenylyltransferase [Marixanthomonas sp. SCSIO 43207]|uniref:pantetheine-phosphate adenylyltransferase n=1 Tax=Marixanthomonas sp. SCSIO 43207 TaxID=2779360 RepID=UPI001CA9B9FF|nr:pantetheine-phosphate adenylyltransferase [Marixanthomonas sp. SCSIO 43207]UAB81375.1 pantetheine-phosphate adenylyltransferase [Marixanthomonas sp. SCSIO 43207]